MKAFSLTNAPHLPVTGESHPLVQESIRWLTTGNAIALLSAMLLFGGLYAWSQMQPEEPPVVKIPGVVDFEDWTPPQITPPTGPRSDHQAPATDDKLAVPDPVTDTEAPENDPFLAPGDWDPGNADDLGDSPVDVPSTPDIKATIFQAFDEEPVLLSIATPVYPELARAAGIDGTVMVKVFVTRAGKVKHAEAVAGPEVLRDAAVAAAMTAVFAPAKQGDNPVDVWVTIPITFSLNR